MVVALIVIAAVVGAIILANQRFIAPWETRQIFYAAFEATPGISPGNGQEVRIAGVNVGDIVEVTVSRMDPMLTGRAFRITQEAPFKTFATAYRVFVDYIAD